jgi:hypothetical protein
MMPYCQYAANPRRCIHCQGTHASEDHHLSVSIPIVSNSGHTGLSLPQEQTQTNTDNNTSHKHKICDSHYRLSNLLSSPHSNHNDHGLYLPDQPRLLRPVV